MASTKPRVLIIGGCGFIGRNLVAHLVHNELCSHIRVLDKVLPSVAYLGAPHKEAFSHELVKYKQANAQSPASLGKRWDSEYDYVFNLASETKYDQDQIIYEEKIVEVARVVIEEAKKHKGLKRIFDISTAQVYAPSSKPANESGKVKPWTGIAEAKLKVEDLWAKSGLPYVILRPAIVYGIGDQNGLMPRITIARVYRHMGSRMKFLWGGDLKLHTVHVQDVCSALWHLTSNGEVGKIYNLADKNDTDQKKMNDLLETIFEIKTGFVNAVACKFAKLNIKAATDTVNNRHLKPWSDLCHEHKIESSPISPFLAPELLYDHSSSVDGSAIEATGFKYAHPKVTVDDIKAELEYWISQGVFPALTGEEKAGDAEEDDEFEVEDA